VWASSRHFRSREGLAVDLRWQAAPFWPSEQIDAAVWQRARPVTVAGRSALALSAADQFVCSCRAAALPTPGALAALADVAALLVDGDVDWPAVLDLAAACHVGRSLLVVCEWLAANVDVAAPGDVLARLRALPVSPCEAHEGPATTLPRGGSSPVRVLRLVYAQFRRTAAAHDRAPQPGDFLTFLQHRWGLASRREIPRQIATRFAQLARRGR